MESLSPETKARLRSRSRLVHLGRDGEASQGFVNLPPFRGSTVIFPDVAPLSTENQRYTYGTHGTPTTDALCEAWTALAGAAGTVLVPTGMAAIALALLSAVGAGDHLLVTDSAYQPARQFLRRPAQAHGNRDDLLRPASRRRDPSLFRPNTKAVFVESPGSQSLEVQDIPAIAEVAHARGALSSPTTPGRRRSSSRPRPGVDLAIEAGTNISPATPTCCSAWSQPTPSGSKRLKRTERDLGDPGRPRRRLSRVARLSHDGSQAARSRAQGLALADGSAGAPRC